MSGATGRIFRAFLSTLSLRRATPVRDIIQWEGIFLSTLSLRRATRIGKCAAKKNLISIHALLAESDAKIVAVNAHCYISIHALLAESDLQSYSTIVAAYISIHALLAESDIYNNRFNALI